MTEILDPCHGDLLLVERRLQIAAPELGLVRGELRHPPADLEERLSRRPAVGRADTQTRGSLALEPCNANHEELVEVRREDGAELQALEQGDVLVLSELEDARVEVEPGELPVEKTLADARCSCAGGHYLSCGSSL